MQLDSVSVNRAERDTGDRESQGMGYGAGLCSVVGVWDGPAQDPVGQAQDRGRRWSVATH